MWIVFIFFSLGALYSTVSSSPPSPIDVTFSSVNLRNLLQWSPGNDTPNDTHYTVQYAIYGDSVEGSRGKRVHWRSVQHCTEVVRCWCDLSHETWDLEQGYYARVRAVSRKVSSKWALTLRRFDPKSDTTFGPPSVMVDTEDNSAIITLKGPMRYQPNNQTEAVSMATLYDQMTYNISIHNLRSSLMSHFQVASSLYKYRLMEYNTKYCFSARTKFLSMPVHCQPSEWHCVTTPPDPLVAQLQWVVVGIVVPFACMCALVVIGCLLYQYLTGKGQKSPYTLNPPALHLPPLIFPLESPNIVLIKVGLPPEEVNMVSDTACNKKQQHILEPPPRYAPQSLETPPEPVEPCDDESLDYSFVCKASETHTREDDEEREGSYDGREDGNSEKKDWGVDNGCSASTYTPQASKSYLSQKSRVSTHVQAHTCVPRNSALLFQSQAPPLIFQEGEKDRQLSGVFVDKNPKTGLFNIGCNVKTEEGIIGEMESGNETAPLLSAYASQNIITRRTSQSDQSNYLSDDYGVLSPAEPHDTEDTEEEEGPICINWDPETGKLVLPVMVMELKKQDELMQGEKERENKTGEEEGGYVMKGGLRLENVFVRQGSEEKAEALREMKGREETGWEADDLFSKWDLVISMDQ
ncbi:interleukin-20 receptor subunit alpha [Halichoeres trimaculatus]|uniref:interleukin-20 receptor subunit alpha n=1 Tax=Halichoeres trimaculatus TaxID=147232 RepID=UPI003D9F0C10